MIIMGDGKKRMVSAILDAKGDNVGDKRDLEEGPEYDELEMIAQELIEAIHARNQKEVAESLRAAFECLDSEPHEEGPHTEEG